MKSAALLMAAVLLLTCKVFAVWNALTYFNASWDNPSGLPVHNPSGPWSYEYYKSSSGTYVLLVPQSGFPWSGQTGWGTGSTTDGSYCIFRPGWGFGGGILDVGITGHAPTRVVFTVPPEVTAPNLKISGTAQEAAGAPGRVLQLQINGQPAVTAQPNWQHYTFDNFIVQNIIPGSKLVFSVASIGADPAYTFFSWDVTIEEYDPNVPTSELTMAVAVEGGSIADLSSMITPSPGTYTTVTGTPVSITAQSSYYNCPYVFSFDHWEGGDISDPNAASTTVTLSEDATVTAVYGDGRACGDQCHPFPPGDYTQDCMVNIADLAAFAATMWLDCGKPECEVTPDTVVMPTNLNTDMTALIEATPVSYPYSFVYTGDTWVEAHRGADLFDDIFVHVEHLLPKPLFFLVNGDFAGGNGSIYRHKQHMALVQNHLSLPVIHSLGNHELDCGLNQGLQNFNSIYGPQNYDFVYGNTHFIVISTYITGPGQTELTFLENTLQQSQSPVKIVMCHQQPNMNNHFDPMPQWSFSSNEAAFHAITQQYNVSLVCCSHWTAYDLYNYQGVWFVTSAAGGWMVLDNAAYNPPYRGNFYHFTQITVYEGGGIEIRVHRPVLGQSPDYAYDYRIGDPSSFE